MLDPSKYSVHLAIILGVIGIISSSLALKTFDKYDEIKKTDKAVVDGTKALLAFSVIITAVIIFWAVFPKSKKATMEDMIRKAKEDLSRKLRR